MRYLSHAEAGQVPEQLCPCGAPSLEPKSARPTVQPLSLCTNLSELKLTCSITSGAIQHGVPTNVCRTFCLERSLPVASQADTPKSAICTVPSSPSRMLPALMSLKYN